MGGCFSGWWVVDWLARLMLYSCFPLPFPLSLFSSSPSLLGCRQSDPRLCPCACLGWCRCRVLVAVLTVVVWQVGCAGLPPPPPPAELAARVASRGVLLRMLLWSWEQGYNNFNIGFAPPRFFARFHHHRATVPPPCRRTTIVVPPYHRHRATVPPPCHRTTITVPPHHHHRATVPQSPCHRATAVPCRAVPCRVACVTLLGLSR